MISRIEIRDFAIIDSLSLDFHQGFHIITGETGAGKSILIEAVSLALGSRADTTFVRSGKEKAVINLTVETEDLQVMDMLRENDLLEEEGNMASLLITREIHASGKSLCRIGGNLISLSFLNRLCRKIADIHGQYDHQSLLNPEEHLHLLDRYDEKRLTPAIEEVAALYNDYISAKKELDDLVRHAADRERQRDFMRFELQEIDAVSPVPGEDEALAAELSLLQNSEQIKQHLSTIYDLFSEGELSSNTILSKAMGCFREIEQFSSEIATLSEAVSDCYYRLEDASSEIRRLRDNVDVSEERLNAVIERLDLLENLKRKYGGSLEQVLSHRDKTTDLLEKVENNQALQEELQRSLVDRREKLLAASVRLTALRREIALELEEKISQELADLNFKDATFTVSFSQPPESIESAFSPAGTDKLEFMLSPNKGEPLKPLTKIASGGEISRIMLAFKRVIGACDRIPTLIFDEIDTGISGITASIVGKKLLDISQSHQVICITHLAQIAAFGDHHYRIEKKEEDGRILTTVTPLKESEKVEEMARLLGGMQITELTLKNAEELLRLSRKGNAI